MVNSTNRHQHCHYFRSLDNCIRKRLNCGRRGGSYHSKPNSTLFARYSQAQYRFSSPSLQCPLFSFVFLNKSLIIKLLLNQPPLGFLLKQFLIPFNPKKIVNDDGAMKQRKLANEIYYINISTIFRPLNQSFTT